MALDGKNGNDVRGTGISQISGPDQRCKLASALDEMV